MGMFDKFFNRSESGTDTINGNNVSADTSTYSTIAEYISDHNIELTDLQKNTAGRIASKLSRQLNIPIKEASNHISGHINSYSKEILQKTMNEIIEKKSPITVNNINHVKLGIEHSELVKKLDINLEDKGLNFGTHHKGSIRGLESSLRIIYTDYLSDVNKLDIEQRDSIVSDIQGLEETSIKCENELRHLTENLIPDKQIEIDDIDSQLKDIGVIGLDSFIDLSNTGNSEMYPIWMMQKMNYKKVLNEFKATKISLENKIQQIAKRIEAYNSQLSEFTYFSKDLLKNRLETFYNGWLKSYAFYEIIDEQKEKCALAFEMLRDDILSKK